MAICNLLSLTVRKNTNYEPEAMTTNQVYSGAVTSAITSPASAQTDSVSLNGRIMDIMGTLTDEQIEAVFKVGYNKAVNDMIDIITTCTDISDKELIDMYLGSANPTTPKTRLRIIRNTSAKAEKIQAANDAQEAETKADEAYQALIDAQTAIKTSKTNEENSKDSTKTQEEIETAENTALAQAQEAKKQAQAAKDAAETARKKAQAVIDAKNKSQDSLDKANSAVELLDGKISGKEIYKLNDILDDADNTKLEELNALETAANEILMAAEEVINALGETVALRNAENFAQQAKQAAENANTETDPVKAKEYAEQARQYAQDAREAVKNVTDTTKINEINSIAYGADALAYAVEAELKMKEAQTLIKEAEAANPQDETLAQQAIKQAKKAVSLAEQAREAAAKVDDNVADAKSLKDKALGKVGLYEADGTTVKVNGSIILLDGSSTGTIEDARDEIFAKVETTFPDIDPETPKTPGSGANEGEDADEDYNNLTADITLVRKDTANNIKTDITINGEKTIKLENSINNKKFTYTISPNTGSSATITKIEFLDNDRLLIVGDNLKIIADGRQCDNIILMGNSNYIDTGDLNDTVRVGIVQDSGYVILSEYNTIIAGSGNDYVETYGYNKVDLSEGDGDYFHDYVDYIKNTNQNCINKYGTLEGYVIMNTDFNLVEPTGYEQTFVTGTSQISNYKFGIASQGDYGDCKFLTFMNTFNGNLEEFVTIEPQSNGYKVTFKKALGGPLSATVTNDEINNIESVLDRLLKYNKDGTPATDKEGNKLFDYKENASGDIDNVLVEIAFRKIIANYDSKQYNMDNYDDGEVIDGYKVYNADQNGNKYYSNPEEQKQNQLGLGYNNFLISEIFYGTRGFDSYILENKSWFKDLLNAYESGTITNIIVGTHQAAKYDNNGKKTKDATGLENNNLGIYYNHAYAIKDFEIDKWIEVCNPWDGADRIRLDWEDFFKYYYSVELIGDSYQYIESMSSTSSMYAGVTKNDGKLLLNQGGYESYLQEQGITVSSSNPFANIFADETPTIYDEIDEITSSIENVKEILEDKKTLELYS